MQRFVSTTARGALLSFSAIARVLAISSLPAGIMMLSVGLAPVPALAQADPPPAPSETSSVGDTVTNPITGLETTVSSLLVDPAGTPTAGDTAFVQTADGYTFLVKSAGETFYNSDSPPIAFTITAIASGSASVTSSEATGSVDFPTGQTTASFDSDFNSSGTTPPIPDPVNVTGPNGVQQVVTGQAGSNGRAGALFVPPATGGNGATGPTQIQTLSSDVNATSNIGWEIGSVGGAGGRGGNSYLSFWSGRDGGDGGAGGRVIATQSATSTIQTSGTNNYGLFAYSRSGRAGDGGSGFAAPGGGTGGHSSDGGHVTVNQSGEISTSGTNAHGIYALSVSNNGGNGGDQWGLVGESGSGGFGGNGGQVDVNTFAGGTILTSGAFANGILAQSIGGSGGSAGISGNLLVSLVGSADNGGNGSTVTVSNGGAIQTSGALSRGIMAQSIGGGGGAGGTAGGLVSLALGGVGSNGGSGGAVSVSNTGTGTIVTTGSLSDGIMAQSIGGSGGQGANAFGLVGVGGSGSSGGSGAAVSVSNFGRIETTGVGARGLVAQSIGGGGGDGGSSAGMVAVGGTGSGGGSGNTVTVVNDGVITTQGDDAMGILAQSIGGGGGNGGSAGAVGAFVGVAVGGGGAAGGAGGAANVTLSDTDPSQPSQIRTEGDRATGVFVQSVGGGGGNGGGAVSVAVGAFGAASVSVGGSGGAGGAGGTAILGGSGSASVQTGGEDATGILLQSVGGGGGNGGYSVAAAASAGPVSGSLAVGVGGAGASGGAGGEVRVGSIDGGGNLTAPGFSGSVVTTGDRSTGMLFQSVGGGGGNGGLAVAASGGGSLIFSGSVSVGVGGSAAGGGAGGRVRVYTDAGISTIGDSATALMVQSVGGGGGNGGGSIAAGVNGSGGGAAGINLAVAGRGAAASAGGNVDLIAGGSSIRTRGRFSTGVLVQSVGGGGGNGGYAIAAGADGAGAGAGNVNISVGGSAGGGGAGGVVNARVDAVVGTRGDDAGAIVVQSIGGGGGNGGFSVAAGAAGGGAGAGNVTVGLGGSGGTGGAGNAVTATVNGDVTTEGDRAAGVVAQSIGGGGGNGGFAVSGAVSGAGVGSGSVAVGLGGGGAAGGSGGAVTADVAGDVTTEGSDSTAILAQSVGGGGGNGGFSVAGTITGSGTGSGAVSVGLGGSGGTGAGAGTVILTSGGDVWTQGDRSSGVVAQSIGGGGGNGGFSVAGSIAGAGVGAGSVSVGLGGSGAGGGAAGAVDSTSNGTILTHGFASSGFVAQSVGGGGGNGGFSVSAALAFGGTGAGSVGVGLGGSGAGGGDGGSVLARTTANIETRGVASTGILAQSIGGGGGNGGFSITPTLSGAGVGSGSVAVGLGGSGAGGGNGGSVGLTVVNSVLTRGNQSAAVVAQSVGGGGGNGGFNVTATGTGAGTGSGAVGVGLGGRGGAGGTGGTVTSSVTGNLFTLGESAGGLVVQSLGGGGGNGGMNVTAAVAVAGTGSGGASVGLGGTGGAGGDSGSATSVLTGNVVSLGTNSSGVTVQSLGGGGGNGGLNVSAIVTGAGTGSGGVSVGLGGSGGDGGNSAAADNTITGNVQTVGDNSSAVVVQSAGGGGGNGGISVSAAVNLSGSGGGALAVGIGGSGGGGGDAGTATSRMTGDILTAGLNSTGLTVQSLGGGGGNGGINVSGTLSATGSGGGGAAIGVGGFGGGGGDAAAALGTLTGDVATAGDRSGGVLVQSLGGGGGNGGLNVSGAVSIAGSGGGAAAIGIGGMGGGGGGAGSATGSVTGDIVTLGSDSTGMAVQSLGGGGGNGGINVSAALSAASSGSGAAAIGVGGFGGDGGDAAAALGTLAGDVRTEGDRSGGVLVQSLGGGGGNGGLNVSGAVSLSSESSGAVGLGIGGAGGLGGAGSTATGSVTGDVTTLGANSAGVMVQSLGGGGGNGGLNVSGAVSIGGSGSGVAAIGVGGFGGGGGVADDVTAAYAGTTLTFGDRSAGIVAQSLGGGGGNGGINVSAGISVGSSFSGAVGLGVGGFGGGGGTAGSVDHGVAGYVQTSGDDSIGVLSQSLGGGGGNGGLNVSGAVSLSRQTSAAVGLGVGGFGGGGADAGPLTASRYSGGVLTFGDRSAGIVTQSLGGGGGNGGANVTGSINLTQESGGAGSLGVGGFGGGGGNGGAVTSIVATGAATDSFQTRGDDSIAVLAQSVGGGGGSGGLNVSGAISLTGQSGAAVALGVGGFGGAGGDAGTVSMDVTGTVSTMGDRAHGLMAQSLGGGGGTGGTNVSGTLALTKPSGSDTIFSIAAGVGGFGGGGGDASGVDVSYSGALTALPRTVNGDGTITLNPTQGANGLVAQSIGGGGGDGGVNVTAGVAISSKPGAGQTDGSKSYGVLVGVGGFGGTGGNAGAVNVDVAAGSVITAHGTGRSGILAQSVGGGGGNGGLNVSGGIVSDTSLIVGVGGMGGNAGRADNVTVTARADIGVTTNPDDFGEPTDDSFEAKLRDVLGDSVVDAAEDMVDSKGLKTLFVDLGLFKGDALPETEGSAGLLAQSIGGGGGNGGLNVSGGLALSKDGKIPSVTFGIGGFGGAANVSGDVLADHAGAIGVAGNWKHGIFAQSVAGGGGNGGLNVSGQLNWGSSEGTGGATDLSIVAGLGGHGGIGADAGNVEVISTGDIATRGYHARGVFAQSIGGGGGTGGMNITAVGTKDSSPVGIGVGGFGASGGDAGDVSVTRGTATAAAGRIDTDGTGAHGIEASSIGGGGGDAGINAVLGFSRTTGSNSNGGTAGDRKTPTNTGVDDSVITNFNAVLDELEGKTSEPPAAGEAKQVNSALIAIGGSAGNAGNGGQVDVTHFGDIETRQNGSHGVFAQSLGGGGGNAALNLGLIFESGNAQQNKGFGLAIGGGTGDGGSGGDVGVANTGDVDTHGDDAHGVFAQSVGGGGGNAGYTSLTTGGEGGNVAIQIGRTGGIGGTAGDVLASSDGEVVTRGLRSHGLFAQSIGNGGGNSSATSISLATPKTTEDKGSNFSLSVGLEGGEGGAAGAVTAQAEGLLYTIGNDSYGIFAQSVGGGGGTGGGAGGSAGAGTSFSLNIGGSGGTGGVSGAVDVASIARIATEGDRSTAIMAQSVGGAGGTGGYVKSGTSAFAILKNLVKGSEVGTTASINVGGTGGAGMISGDVGVETAGVVTTDGDYAHGVFAQSVGGGGGMGGLVDNTIVNLRSTIATTATLSVGGSGGTGAVSGDVDVLNRGTIATAGAKSAGILAMAVGGGGGDAQYVRNILAGADADNSSRNALLIGGSGGTGAAGGAVSVANVSAARILTEGAESHGIFAQSVGGGGGNGGDVLSVSVSRPGSTAKVRQGLQLGIGGSGGAGGTGGAVEVSNDGVIITRGAGAHGVLAQSVGGGGGNGGYSITGTAILRTGTSSDPTLALNIGGSGGSGNAAGTVSVANRGQIDVSGDGAHGVLAQSVGGGGGNGGVAVSLSLNDLANQARGRSYSKIAIGGAGGDGADGGDVSVTHSGTITVRGDNAFGILAQSVGGSGGNAGLSISTPVAMVADYVVSTLLGARTGTDGTAGTVTVDSTGDIVVLGANSQAILNQSVNGGGGNVQTFLDFTRTEGSAARPRLAAAARPRVGVTSLLSLGGRNVSGSAGSDLSQTHRGDMLTTAARATGMMVQSVGGGGGTALTDVRAGSTGDLGLRAMLGARNTDDAGGGDIIARRIGAVETRGAMSAAGLVQSVGGGGGRLTVNVGAGRAGTGTRAARVTLGADPSFRNHGGDVALTLRGAIATLGDHASGQIVQSIGAGGGQAMLAGLDRATITLGASDGSTGDGGAISLANRGTVSTAGDAANGFVLQSIGGGGGLIATDLTARSLVVNLSAANGGDGGDIGFSNRGHVLATGRDAVGVLAQSLGGGGGAVDGLFRGAAGGAGRGGAIDLDLSGNIMSLGRDGIAVMAQSAGRDGADSIGIALDGVIVGGSGTTAPRGVLSARAPVSPAGSTAGPAAIVIDGGTMNTVTLSADSFLMSLNQRILSGGAGADQVTLNGGAVGNVDLGGGVNRLTIARGASFTALDLVDLGTDGSMRINGDLYLGGDPYLAGGRSLGAGTRASQFRLTQNVSQTTDLTGSLSFGRSATYTPDVYFRADGAAGGESDLIRVSGDATLSGTVRPVLQLLERTRPLALIEAGGRAVDDGTVVIDTAVIDYAISVSRAGGIGSINLLADVDFALPGTNRNQSEVARYINRVLSGRGSVQMGPIFALIANMQTRAEVIDALDRLTSEGYAATQASALHAGRQFAGTMGNCDKANMAARPDDVRACYWVAAEAANLERAATGESKRFALDSSTFSAGMRMPVGDDLYLGMAAGFENYNLSNGDRFAADGKRAHLGVSLSTYRGPWEAYGQLTGSKGDADVTRIIGITGTLPNGDIITAGRTRVSQSITQANIRIGGGYRYQPEGSSFYLRPGLDLDATWLHSAATSERGDRYGLELKKTSQWVLSATPSVEIGADMQVDDRNRMRAYLRGEMTFANADDVYVNAAFPGTSPEDGTFRNYSQISDRTRRLKAGVTFYSDDNTGYMSVGYQGEWGRDTVGHTASLSFGMRF
ncbi:autotransporter outer membrane beta-barrel domain-containing protein [Paracoccus salsus]|uniref:autotransporter outer membrane beta-barrel domain-containing protein n=1 Tax=Paracoccus salsus TaxID=2911061 RepID=UPI001F3A6905|nr:autotransporter outer membrane beta-barrel domain-containing protein [Paracoccus salsus]MCF3973213.1 autotransporter outer membrane beta-barrel domain-containing protein [Paracoccus salsus]